MGMRVAPTPVIPVQLQDPLHDKGTAFTQAERDALGLTRRLPSAVQTLDQQAQRAYQQMLRQGDDMAKNVYMEELHDRNECCTTACSPITCPSCCRSYMTR